MEKNKGDDILEIADEFIETDFNQFGPLNELDQPKLPDTHFAEEIQRDKMNNHLMNRMNSDIHIQEIRRDKLKNFETPFSSLPDDKYAPFHNDPSIIPNQDFTAKSRFNR